MTIARRFPLPVSSALRILAGFAICFPLAVPAHALGPGERARQQADRISGFVSETTRARQRERLGDLGRIRSERAPAAAKAEVSGTNGPCVHVTSINVSGAERVGRDRIRRAVAPFEGKCLGLAGFNAVLKALTYLYVERGYVASRAYLPQQDLSDGSLDIRIVEGKLEDIVPAGGQGTPGQLATAFPGLKGKPVNLRDVEQGIDQINRLGTNRATAALAAGKSLGGTVLSVTVKKGAPWYASVATDNLGSPYTGIFQSSVSLGLDSPLGLNDQWLVNYQRTMDGSPVSFRREGPESDTAAAYFSIPYGYLTAGLDASWSRYRSSVPGWVAPVGTSGRSLSISPYVTLILNRDRSSKSWVTGRFTWKSNDNFILGNRIDVSSRILSVAQIELGHSRQWLGGVLTASVGYEQGLRAFGAFSDATAPAGSPRGQFHKGTASFGYSRSSDIGPATATFSTTASGQYSPDPLFASEQLALGGFSTVRGVRDAVLSGSDAFFLRGELSVLLPAWGPRAVAEALGRLEPYVALDFGRSFARASDGSLGGGMAGGTIGLRSRGGRLGFDISWSRILSASALPAGAIFPKSLVEASVRVRF